MYETTGKTLGIFILLALIFGSPFVTIWAINSLFGLTIGYTFTNYFAALWLTIMITARNNSKVSK